MRLKETCLVFSDTVESEVRERCVGKKKRQSFPAQREYRKWNRRKVASGTPMFPEIIKTMFRVAVEIKRLGGNKKTAYKQNKKHFSLGDFNGQQFVPEECFNEFVRNVAVDVRQYTVEVHGHLNP